MSQEQLEKHIPASIDCADGKLEAEKVPASIDAAEEKKKCVVAEASGEKVEGEVSRKKLGANSPSSEGTITIGEALEAAVLTAGNKPVEWSDAAAIQAAEVRATGRTNIMPGGVAASAQSAATLNARVTSEDDKTTLADVLTVSNKITQMCKTMIQCTYYYLHLRIRMTFFFIFWVQWF
ncbi:late embryogenesis abundant protein 47 [Capsella rubella]|uniref:late embryogenesis abundant protein 47 n=1 Tax=Capsella rubella TaxID=81985 RepID=UPI000CD4DEFF|nr:late embryogenesis abundant protein 47 [Capsella rubella]